MRKSLPILALALLLVMIMATGAWATSRSDFAVGAGASAVTNNAIDEGQRVAKDVNHTVYYNPHGSFQSNTFACAECHRTHDAAGEKLIRASNNTALCEACHDGTSSAYNVLGGKVNGNEGASAGGFQKYKGADVISNHLRSGNENDQTQRDSAAGFDIGKVWALQCTNCHNPHGQTVTVGSYQRLATNVQPNELQTGNDRLLESAPITIDKNDPVFGTLEKVATGTYHKMGDNNVTVSDATYGLWWRSKADPKVGQQGQIFSGIWKTEGGAAAPTIYRTLTGVPAQVGDRVYAVDVEVVTLSQDTDDLLCDHDFTAVRIKVNSTWRILPGTEELKAEFRPVMMKPVALDFTNKYSYGTPGAVETVTYLANMNYYCGTCHYDFFINLGADDAGKLLTARSESGQYSKAFRHAVGVSGPAWWYDNATTGPWKNTFTMGIENKTVGGTAPYTYTVGVLICQSCHYVHGSPATSVDRDRAGGEDNSLLRANDRIVCQSCHNKISENDFTNETLRNYAKWTGR